MEVDTFVTPTRKGRVDGIAQTPQTPRTPEIDVTTKRRVSDILVTLHKYIQEWQTNNQSSFDTANTLSSLYNQWSSTTDEGTDSEIIDLCKLQYNAKLYHTREDLISHLKKHEEKFRKLFSDMSGLVVNLKAIYYMGLSTGSTDSIIFNSWSAEKFYQNARLILNMYSKEYLLKTNLYSKFFKYRIENDEDRSAVVMLNKYVSIWLHQPFIDNESCKVLLDAMLIEAELK